VAGAGEIVVNNGKISMLNNSSGHYVPTRQQLDQVISQLEASGVDLSDANLRPGF